MKKILTLMLIVCSFTVFGQKALKENFGNYRVHKITSFHCDTISFDTLIYKADFTIYREGIDGNYSKEVHFDLYNDYDNSIEYFATKPEYIDFIIVK